MMCVAKRQDAFFQTLHFVSFYNISLAQTADRPNLTSEKGVLITEVLAAIRLTEADDTRGIETASLGCAAGCDTEAERDIGHAIDDDSGVLGAVLGPTADVGLDDCF